MSKVNVCIVGLGHWGPNIVRSLQANPHVNVVAAIDGSEERREFVRTKIPGLHLMSSLGECLSSVPEVDAVVIATPTESHHQLGMEALSAGKHVLMEKPLAHTSEGADELWRTASQKGLVLMTGHVFLYNNAIREMKRIVDAEELGRVLYMRSLRSNLGPIRSDVNALWDLAAHDISIFNYLYGDSPIRVSCTAFSPLGLKQQDVAQGSLIYPGNRVATFFVSWVDPKKQREITLVGDRQMLVFDDMNPTRPLKRYDKGARLQRREDTYSDSFHSFHMSIHQGETTELDVQTGAPLQNECDHFIECIVNKTTPLSDGANGLEVVKILEALTRSLNSHGEPVSVWNSNKAVSVPV